MRVNPRPFDTNHAHLIFVTTCDTHVTPMWYPYDPHEYPCDPHVIMLWSYLIFAWSWWCRSRCKEVCIQQCSEYGVYLTPPIEGQHRNQPLIFVLIYLHTSGGKRKLRWYGHVSRSSPKQSSRALWMEPRDAGHNARDERTGPVFNFQPPNRQKQKIVLGVIHKASMSMTP